MLVRGGKGGTSFPGMELEQGLCSFQGAVTTAGCGVGSMWLYRAGLPRPFGDESLAVLR